MPEIWNQKETTVARKADNVQEQGVKRSQGGGERCRDENERLKTQSKEGAGEGGGGSRPRPPPREEASGGVPWAHQGRGRGGEQVAGDLREDRLESRAPSGRAGR